MKISEQQFNFVYTEYSKELYNIAYGYTKNKDDSIDITQNVFVKLLESKKDFKSNEDIKYFLIRVVINESINFIKSNYKKRVIKSNDIVMISPENNKDDLQEDISIFVDKLPQKYKSIIILYYYDLMKIKDISKAINISEAAVRKRLERARNLIKEMMGGNQ